MLTKIKFFSKEWGGISLEAKDLISNLLVRDATKRYTAEMVLRHQWLQEVRLVSMTMIGSLRFDDGNVNDNATNQ